MTASSPASLHRPDGRTPGMGTLGAPKAATKHVHQDEKQHDEQRTRALLLGPAWCAASGPAGGLLRRHGPRRCPCRRREFLTQHVCVGDNVWRSLHIPAGCRMAVAETVIAGS